MRIGSFVVGALLLGLTGCVADGDVAGTGDTGEVESAAVVARMPPATAWDGKALYPTGTKHAVTVVVQCPAGTRFESFGVDTDTRTVVWHHQDPNSVRLRLMVQAEEDFGGVGDHTVGDFVQKGPPPHPPCPGGIPVDSVIGYATALANAQRFLAP